MKLHNTVKFVYKDGNRIQSMPQHNNNFKNYLGLGHNDLSQIIGLETFKKSLEKDFFSEVTVRNCSSDNTHINLAVEVDCNFKFQEAISVLSNEKTIELQQNSNGDIKKSSITNAFLGLIGCNELQIDFEEFAIFLNDVTIVIHKIYDRSIPDQLELILRHLVAEHSQYTNRLSDIPCEIYIPVYEEGPLDNDLTMVNITSGKSTQKDYFGFWGLYFDSKEDATIYDLKTKSIITGDLFLLNH